MNLNANFLLSNKAIHGFIIVTLGGICWAFLTSMITIKLLGLSYSDHGPTTAFQYWWHYGDNPMVSSSLSKAASWAGLVVVGAIFTIAVAIKSNSKKSLFGDAKFANDAEIKKAGLHSEKGIILGKKKGKFLIIGGQQHVFLDAPSRSGKGVGVVIPNLLNWPDSAVVIDIKRENWDITAGFRSRHGQECFLFDPLSPDFRTHRWNPLGYVNSDSDAFAIDDIMRIGSMIWSETAGNQGFFEGLARNLFIGFAAMIRSTPDLPFTLGECLRQSMQPNLSEYLQELIEDREENGPPLPPQSVEAFNAFCGTSPNVQGSILATYQQKLELFTNPLIDAATSDNDFDLRDVRKKRMTIYLATTPDNLDRIAPLINLFLQQLVNLNTQELPEHNSKLKYQCLLLNDEFTAIGKIPILSKAVSYVAGYGLRLLTIVQSPAQLRAVYGHDQADNYQINHPVRVVFATKENAAAREISESLGYTTVKSKSKSFSSGGNSLIRSPGTNESPAQRALLLPQEVKDLGKKKELIFIEGVPPIMADKIFFFSDRAFDKRKNLKTPTVPIREIQERTSSPGASTKKTTKEFNEPRAVKAEEVSSLESMLNDFTCDFSSVEVPKSGASEDEKKALVDQLFDIMDNATQ